MKQGEEKKSDDTRGQKGEQTELMRLLVPICKVFGSPETHTHTLSLYQPSPERLAVVHSGTFEVC